MKKSTLGNRSMSSTSPLDRFYAFQESLNTEDKQLKFLTWGDKRKLSERHKRWGLNFKAASYENFGNDYEAET
jgi:hypothetical protein